MLIEVSSLFPFIFVCQNCLKNSGMNDPVEDCYSSVMEV
jgi:hypothetical protein